MERKILIIIIIVLLVLGVVTYFVIEYGLKKWKCREGHCEKVIGGDFSSLEKCRNQCGIKQPYRTDHDRRLLEKRRERIHKHTKQRRTRFSPDLLHYPKS